MGRSTYVGLVRRSQGLLPRGRSLLRHGLDARGDLFGGLAEHSRAGLQGHELREITLDPDLATEKRGHRRLRILFDEQRPGRDIVDRHGHIGVGQVAMLKFDLARRRVEMGVQGAVAERHFSDDLIHAHGHDRRDSSRELLSDLFGRLDPGVR